MDRAVVSTDRAFRSIDEDGDTVDAVVGCVERVVVSIYRVGHGVDEVFIFMDDDGGGVEDPGSLIFSSGSLDDFSSIDGLTPFVAGGDVPEKRIKSRSENSAWVAQATSLFRRATSPAEE